MCVPSSPGHQDGMHDRTLQQYARTWQHRIIYKHASQDLANAPQDTAEACAHLAALETAWHRTLKDHRSAPQDT
eukprot:1161864-Pelagomonas_calceolata.AAC.4